MKCTQLEGKLNMEPELLKDFHDYGANINTREIFLHNHYHAEDNQNPGVEYRMSNTFIKNLRALDLRNNNPITIHMQSVGGEWPDGMAIFDAIAMCRSYVSIIVYGQAESMSSIILQSADYRYMTPNSYFMSHYGSTAVGSDYLSVQNFVDYERRCASVMFDLYAKRCVEGQFFKDKFGKKPSEKQVKQYLIRKLKSGDWYLNAEEAVYYGFADAILTDWNRNE
jgi:ATP-dependent protease ClpP protease subunit